MEDKNRCTLKRSRFNIALKRVLKFYESLYLLKWDWHTEIRKS